MQYVTYKMEILVQSQCRICCALIAILLIGTDAYAQQPTDYEKKDNKAGLSSDGGQWGFRKGDNPDGRLPKVLLIGDSILIGYAPEVRRQLKGKVQVDCLLTGLNIGLKEVVYEQVKRALENGPYEIVHFNDMGLHGWQPERIAKDQYEPLLKAYLDVIRSGAGDAMLIWTATTPITTKELPRKLAPNDSTIAERNVMAARIMAEAQIPVDDLYGLMAPHLDMARGDQFHWTVEGQILQGRQVASVIDAALAARRAGGGHD